MSTPFLGEIRMFGGTFAPRGWTFCNGQLLAISENSALFALLGTTYGGDGQTTFGIPDMRGRVPIHQGQGQGLTNRVIGEASGSESVTLTTSELPIHTHQARASSLPGAQLSPLSGVWAVSTEAQYSSGTPAAAMNAQASGSAGGSQPHDNLIPVLAVSFILATEGVFPSQN